jgi:hypothetical protein
VQNAKLFVNEVTAAINVASVASQVLASKQLSTCVAKNRLHDKTTAASPQMTQDYRRLEMESDANFRLPADTSPSAPICDICGPMTCHSEQF